MWWTRNDDGFWCDFCGENLKPSFHFRSDEEWDDFEEELDGGGCSTCGAPDEFEPEAF